MIPKRFFEKLRLARQSIPPGFQPSKLPTHWVKDWARQRFLSPAAYHILSNWVHSWNYVVIESDQLRQRLAEQKPCVFAHWHGDELSLIPLIRPYRTATMVSKSKDGELMNQIYQRFGGTTSRGSSSRGAIAALKGLIRLMKSEGRSASIAVDGPKGPLHKVKPGALELAKVTGAPIFAAGVANSNPLIFEKAWNKASIGKPFSQTVVVWEGPFWVDRNIDVRAPESLEKLEEMLHSAHRQARQFLESKKPE